MGDSCCYQCKKRCVGCKTNCVEWIAEKTAKDLAAIQRAKERETRDVVDGYNEKSFYRTVKSMQLQRRGIKIFTR